MQAISELLASGRDPFLVLPEGDVLAVSRSALASDYRSEFIDYVDEHLAQLEERRQWVAILLAHLRAGEWGTDRAAAGRALVRHLELLVESDALQLIEALAGGVASEDDFLAVQCAFLGVVAARSRLALRYRISAALIARSPSNTPEAAVAERFMCAIGLLEAAFPDNELRQSLEQWLHHAEPTAQAEASFQLGRAELRQSPRDYPSVWSGLRRARAYFRSAENTGRGDVALYATATDLILRAEAGIPDASVIDDGLRALRGLAAARWFSGDQADVWRAWEEHFLLRGIEQLSAASDALRDIDAVLNAAEPLLSLAHAAHGFSRTAEQLGIEPWLANEAASGAVQLSTAETLRVRLPRAQAKIDAELATTDDAAIRDYLTRLRDALAADVPKAAGDEPRAPPPAISVPSQALQTNTGWPQADAVVVRLLDQMQTLGLPDEVNARELLLAATEIVVGFIAARTNAPQQNLRFEQPNYWRAAPDGPGPDALEEDVRTDLYRYAQVLGFDYLLSKEQAQMGGRTDVRLTLGSSTLVIETKREKRDVTKPGLHAYVVQAQSYVGISNRWAVLLALDLTPKTGRPDTFVNRFWVDRADPGIGTDARPEHVLVAVVSGNRLSPSNR